MSPEQQGSLRQNCSDKFLEVFNQLGGNETQLPYLAQEPLKNELKFLVSNPLEFGLIRLKDRNRWKVWRQQEGSLGLSILRDPTSSSDILAHTHFPEDDPYGLPSPNDIYYAPNSFIIWTEGISYFTKINRNPENGQPWDNPKKEDINRFHTIFSLNYFAMGRDIGNSLESRKRNLANAYKNEFLGQLGVALIQKKWHELPDKNPLSNFAKEV